MLPRLHWCPVLSRDRLRLTGASKEHYYTKKNPMANALVCRNTKPRFSHVSAPDGPLNADLGLCPTSATSDRLNTTTTSDKQEPTRLNSVGSSRRIATHALPLPFLLLDCFHSGNLGPPAQTFSWEVASYYFPSLIFICRPRYHCSSILCCMYTFQITMVFSFYYFKGVVCRLSFKNSLCLRNIIRRCHPSGHFFYCFTCPFKTMQILYGSKYIGHVRADNNWNHHKAT